MNPQQAAKWQNSVVGEVLKAVVAHEPLRDALIFKGARILNLHLGTERQSLDIDSHLTPEFVSEHRDLDSQKAWLESHVLKALRNYFENQEPVRFSFQKLAVERNPPKEPHPRNWDGLFVKIKVHDEKHRNVKNLQNVELDVAATETLGINATTWILLDGLKLRGYALHRIAGEKMRAFLQSLPAHLAKLKRPVRPARARDIHDLARILAKQPKEREEFWAQAAEEFRLACGSRYVDCVGLRTFLEHWELTRQTYESDATLAAISFQDAEDALRTVVALFEGFGVFPLAYPLSQ